MKNKGLSHAKNKCQEMSKHDTMGTSIIYSPMSPPTLMNVGILVIFQCIFACEYRPLNMT